MNDAGRSKANDASELNNYLVANQNIEPVLVSGSGAEVFDRSDKSFIDLEAGPGVANVGHCHPAVVDAIKRQAEKLLQIPGRYHSTLTLDLAKRLAALTGERLRRTFFANSGAEANEGAIKCDSSTPSIRASKAMASSHSITDSMAGCHCRRRSAACRIKRGVWALLPLSPALPTSRPLIAIVVHWDFRHPLVI